MNIDSLVNLQIVISDRIANGSDLGTPFVLGYHTAWPALVRSYSDHEEMLDDGFTVNSYPYKIVRAIKSQENAPPTVKVGRRRTALVQTLRLIPTVTTAGYVYSGVINETAWDVTVQPGDVLADVCDDFVTEITPIADCTITDGTTHVDLTATSGLWIDVDAGAGVNVLDMTPDTTTDDDIAACVAEDDEWYGYTQEASSPASIALVAAYTEAVRKIAFVQSPDWNIADGSVTTDIASTLQTAGYNRTFGLWHHKTGGTEWAAASWMAGRMTARPGSETWAFKTLNGISADALTTSQQTAIKNKDWNHYTRTGSQATGINMTFDGGAGGGRYGDITHFVDWLYVEIQIGIVTLLANNPKVGYDDEGAAAVASVVRGALQRGERAKGIRAGTISVTVPRVADIPPEVRATRILPDVEFSAELMGAIHGVVIRGRVTT